MKILVCGSRYFEDKSLFKMAIEQAITCDEEEVTIISGEARGADTLAKRYAMLMNMAYEGYPADWNKHGKAAGPIRNKQMLDEGKPDLVIAFLAPNSRGTKNMIEQAEKAGVPVKIINI